MNIILHDPNNIIDNTFYITAYFGNDYVEIENEYYKHNEILTELFNYNFSNFFSCYEALKINRENKSPLYDKSVELIKDNLSNNPLLKKLGMKTFLKNGNPPFEFYQDLAESFNMIQDQYKFFSDALHTNKESLSGDSEKRRFLNLSVFENSSIFTGETNDFSASTGFEVRRSARTNSMQLFERMTFSRFIDFIYVDFYRGIMKDFSPKKCKLCGKYFLQDNGHIYEYCNNPSESNPQKTCREIGSKKSFQNKSKNDEVWQIYLRAYKKYHSRKQKGLMTQDEFTDWQYTAEDIRDKALRERDALIKQNKPFDIVKYKKDINYVK